MLNTIGLLSKYLYVLAVTEVLLSRVESYAFVLSKEV